MDRAQPHDSMTWLLGFASLFGRRILRNSMLTAHLKFPQPRIPKAKIEHPTPQRILNARKLLCGLSVSDMKRSIRGASTLFLLFARIVHAQNSYSTNFPVTEEPISENGYWISGGTIGLDWSNVRTIPGFAFAAHPSYESSYNDPIAILNGAWGATQKASVTIVCNGCDDTTFNEVEIELNTTITAHNISGYEVNCRVPDNAKAYFSIVRWNGALADFTILKQLYGQGCKNGDVFSAVNVKGVITGFLNGVAVVTASDATFKDGAPGIGFDSCGLPQTPSQCTNSFTTYGISSFSASNSPPLWSGRHYNLKRLPLFVSLGLPLLLTAIASITLMFRDVFSVTNQGGPNTCRDSFAGRFVTINVWKQHAGLFPQSTKRKALAFSLMTAAISVIGYVLWLIGTSSRTIQYR
jgi:hypothetical protein